MTNRQAAELVPKIIRRNPAPDVLANVPHPSPEQEGHFRDAVKANGFTVPASVAQQLEKVDAPWMRLCAAMGTYSQSAANEGYQKHVADLAKKIAAGDETHTEQDAWTREQYQEDYAIRRQAIKAEMRILEQKADEIAFPVLDQYAEALTALADELEIPLREQAESFAAPYSSPPFILLMRKSAQIAASHAVATGRPATRLEHLLEK